MAQREARGEADRPHAQQRRVRRVVAVLSPGRRSWSGRRKELVVALDWTEFDADDHATLAGYLMTSAWSGNAADLADGARRRRWKGKRNGYEYRLIERLHECVAAGRPSITVLADRGFGDQKLYRLLEALGLGLRDSLSVQPSTSRTPPGETKRPAGKWLPPSGRATMLMSHERMLKDEARLKAEIEALLARAANADAAEDAAVRRRARARGRSRGIAAARGSAGQDSRGPRGARAGGGCRPRRGTDRDGRRSAREGRRPDDVAAGSSGVHDASCTARSTCRRARR
jgi:hypothetical protein